MEDSSGLWQIVLGWVPTIVWAGVVVTALVLLRKPLRQLLPRLEKVNVAGVDVSFVADDLGAAARAKKVDLPPNAIRNVARRAADHADLLRGARVVWLEPSLDNIEPELDTFLSLGLGIVVLDDVDEAVSAAGARTDVVISNWGQAEQGSSNAVRLAQGLRDKGLRLPVIIYTRDIDEDYQAKPAGIFAETTRPDRLLHFVIDALEHSAHDPYRQP
ncbi:hypothetical protein [Actinomycetospora callitridis]|uniref:hypothetical protein n=1 Tax=Actinomycetospora callitridis TaxID=913944 RepID=UPI0023654BA0|nr:hypothetical protein [Actinomycetospora callitridis]MDD7918010.1 hypothetical protein [Actinomycetospora callitridis]